MAESTTPEPTVAEIAVAQNVLEGFDRTFRGLQSAKDALAVLIARKNLADELDRQIEAKRDTLAQLEAKTLKGFQAQGEAEAKRIVNRAEVKASEIVDAAKQRADEIDVIASGKRAELDTINARLAEVRKQAAALAG